jgi:nicotinamide mononucleotide adenylyltransferase
MAPHFAEASAHGRFQPLHNEHVEYLLKAKDCCDFLWIGITLPDVRTHANPLGRERERPTSNPLTYFERTKIIRSAMLESGLAPHSFECVPFPIETPLSLPNFLPLDVSCLTTVCEDWNKEKIDVLQKCGYSVHVLFERSSKQITGFQIRQLILNDDAAWERLVPRSVAATLKQLDIKSRLEKLNAHPIG